MKIIFIKVGHVLATTGMKHQKNHQKTHLSFIRRGVRVMDQHKVFAPIADPGQLAHLSASHSNALVENPFDDAAEAADAAEAGQA